ncbi:hypothetical protein BC2230_40457 [Burkholderia cepacia]|uniref:hypothetical protein n=1 Tax=Burkholderia cepacia TaxID=292 RepID=UPI0039A643FA
MTEKKPRGRQIHVEMPADEYDAFKALAKKQERTLQGLARKLIRDELERHTRAAEWNIDREYIAYKQPPYSAALVPHEIEEFWRLIGESNKEQS